ncbi:unnamed protein product, partial [Iphiclides podalirius]
MLISVLPESQQTPDTVCIGKYFVCFRTLKDVPKKMKMMHRPKGLKKSEDIQLLGTNKYNNNDVFYQVKPEFYVGT